MGGCVSQPSSSAAQIPIENLSNPNNANSNDKSSASAPADSNSKPVIPPLSTNAIVSIHIPSSTLATPTATTQNSQNHHRSAPESLFISLTLLCSNCEELSSGLSVWCKDCGSAALTAHESKSAGLAPPNLGRPISAHSHNSSNHSTASHNNAHHAASPNPTPRHMDDSSTGSIHPPVLCSACDKELHKFAKTSSHMRTAVNFHRHHKLKSPNSYGFSNNKFPSNSTHFKIPDNLESILCHNCDSDSIQIYCLECKTLYCSECCRDLHLPKIMKFHHIIPIKKSFVCVKNPTSDMMSLRMQSNRNKKAAAAANAAAASNKNGGGDSPAIKAGGSSLFFEAMAEVEKSNAAEAEKKRNEIIEAKARAAAAAAVLRAAAKTESNTPASSVTSSPMRTSSNSSSLSDSSVSSSSSSSSSSSTGPLPDIRPVSNPGSAGDLLLIQDISTSGGGSTSVSEIELRNLTNPFDIIGNVSIVQLSVGLNHCGAVTQFGSLFMWGSNNEGQLGFGDSFIIDDGEKSLKIPRILEFQQHKPVKEIRCGHIHTMALMQTNEIYSWGSGLMGVLGHSSDADRSEPVKLNLNLNHPKQSNEIISSISVGQQNSAAIVNGRTDGQIYIWGEGSCIGNGLFKPQITPILIKIIDSTGQMPIIVDIQFGHRHALIRTAEGELYSWGSNDMGQLGYPEIDNKSYKSDAVEVNLQLIPKRVDYFVSINRKIISIACGERHSTVLTNKNEVYSFGSGETHQIGIMDNIDQFIPVPAVGLNSHAPNSIVSGNIVSISVGQSISAAVSDSGLVYGWGYGIEQPLPTLLDGLKGSCIQSLGIGNNDNIVGLTKLAHCLFEWQFDGNEIVDEDNIANENPATNAAAGPATIEEGDEDENGDGAEEDENSQLVPQLGYPKLNSSLRGKQITSMSAGKAHYGATTADGKLYMWGSNAEFQLGISFDSEKLEYLKPIEIPVESQSIIDIKCSVEHSLALTSDGLVLSFGLGGEGRLGLNNDEDSPDPTTIPLFMDKKIIISSIAIGPVNGAAISNTGQLYLWGAGGVGQLGNPQMLPQFEPELCKSLKNEKVKSIAFGNCHTLVLTLDGKIYTFGDNRFGQLGQGSINAVDSSAKPLLVHIPGYNHTSSAVKPIQIDCGDNVCLVLMNSGEVYGWGTGETNQICGTPNKSNDEENNNNDDDNADDYINNGDIPLPKKCVFPFYSHQAGSAPCETSLESIDLSVYNYFNNNSNKNDHNKDNEIPIKIISISVCDINCSCLCSDGSIWRWGWDFGPIPAKLKMNDKSNPLSLENEANSGGASGSAQGNENNGKEKEVQMEWKQMTLGFKRMLLIA